jgi:threonine dehydrogenase-like Zn-dependent dehydrogenase
MKALVWSGPEQLAVEEVPDAVPADGEVLLTPQAVGICGSEVEGYLGRQANRTPPLVMGHEFAGTVVDLGTGVDPAWLGAPVAVNPLIPSPGAREGHENLGRDRVLIGVNRPGAFAAAVAVPQGQLRRLPAGTDPRLGALAEPLANGIHSVGLGLRERDPGEVPGVIVIGAGAIGVMVIQAAAMAGISHVACVELNPARREVALSMGAHSSHASGEEARAVLGGDVTVVIDAVGAAGTRSLALELLRDGGTAVMLGLADDAVAVGFHSVVRRELTLRGSYGFTFAEYDRALADLLEGRARLPELPPVEPLEAGPDRFAELATGPRDVVKRFLAS